MTTTTIRTQKLKIYDVEGWVNPIRIRIVLHEKQLMDRVEFIPINLLKAEHRTAVHYQRNPLGTVPVLELADGTYISECTAITEYTDNIDGKPQFTGTTPKEKGVIHMRQRQAESMVLDPIGIWFHYATRGLGPKAETKRAWYNWKHREEWGQLSKQTAIDGMRYFDQLLLQQPYIAGGSVSMADLTLLAGLHFARLSDVPVPPECTTLIAWHQRLYDRYYPPHKPLETQIRRRPQQSKL